MEGPVWEHQFMRECPTLAFVTAFSLIANTCANVTQRRLNLPKHSMRVLEVHTSNISKSFLRITRVYTLFFLGEYRFSLMLNILNFWRFEAENILKIFLEYRSILVAFLSLQMIAFIHCATFWYMYWYNVSCYVHFEHVLSQSRTSCRGVNGY